MKRKGPKSSKDFKNSIVFQRELAKMLTKELKAMQRQEDILYRALQMAGSACGIAADFLEFHGIPSPQLNNCIRQMQNHEKMAEKITEPFYAARACSLSEEK